MPPHPLKAAEQPAKGAEENLEELELTVAELKAEQREPAGVSMIHGSVRIDLVVMRFWPGD